MESALSRSPVAFVVNLDGGERVVSFRPCVIKAKRFADVFFRKRPNVRWKDGVRCSPRIIKAQSGVSGRIRRIERHCLLKVLPNPLIPRRVKVSPLITPFQIQLVRFSALGRTRRNRAARPTKSTEAHEL